MVSQLQKELTILSLPAPLASNPYQKLLYAACSDAGASILSKKPSLARLLRRRPKGTAILHVHWIWLKSGLLARPLRAVRFLAILLAARALGWTIVWTVHNLEPHEAKSLDRRATGWLRALAQGFICHNGASRARLQGLLRQAKPIAEIPHGHYIDSYPPAPPREEARARLGIESDETLFLFLGQIRPYKGVLELCAAFREASPWKSRLLIAGECQSPELRQALGSAIADTPLIRWDQGAVADGELGLYFAAADWAVLPFREVTTSGSLILAHGFGCPVLVPRGSGLEGQADPEAILTYERGQLGERLRELSQRDGAPHRAAARRSAEALAWPLIGRLTVAFMRGLR